MDVIELIKKQVTQINESDNSIYLDAVRLHIERAEFYYIQGRDDSSYYNDVIYRTNQSFEGALKEAYKVLADKTYEDVEKETPYKIEKYLETNNIFKERVLELFRNYRSQWRNKSTHDYKLFFDENEAFIALISVSSFVHLLLKQISEKIAFDTEKDNVKKSKARQKKIDEILKSNTNTLDLVTSLIGEFTTSSKLISGTKLYESEILGMLNGYFSASKQNLIVYNQPLVDKKLRPDYIIEKGDDKVVIEVKRYLKILNIEPAINQLLTYLKHANISNGILYALSSKTTNKKIKTEDREMKVDDRIYTIRIIEN